MSKFLQIIETHLPSDSIDAVTEFKRSLQRLLISSGFKTQGNFGEDYLIVDVNGKQIKLSVEATATEDGEDLFSTAAETDPGAANSVRALGKQINSAAKAATARLQKIQAKQAVKPII